MTAGSPQTVGASSGRFASARWAVVEELDAGRWRLRVHDEADDELGAVGFGVEGSWDPDVLPVVELLLGQLGLRLVGVRPWREDELGDQRAPVLPAS